MILSDAELIVSWRNALDARSMFFNCEELSMEQHMKWFKGCRCNRVDYVFCENSKGKAIGTVNFKNIDELAGCAEAGKLLGDISFRKKGLATEAFAAWLQYGFDVLKLKHIYVFTRQNNIANINLNLKLGFKVVESEEEIKPSMEDFIKMEISMKAMDALNKVLLK